MERPPAEPWKVRDRMLSEIGLAWARLSMVHSSRGHTLSGNKKTERAAPPSLTAFSFP
jgi:hypothetical protein